MPREVSKVGPILGICGGITIIISVPISLIFISDLYNVEIGDIVEYVFSFPDALAALIAFGIIMVPILGIVCIILSCMIYKKGVQPSVRGYIFGLSICGIFAAVTAFILIGGILGAVGGFICMVGGYLALREVQKLPAPPILEGLEEQYFCERCRHEIAKDAKYCPNCGTKFEV